ncbi:uncharacterized protein LOC131860129 [Cryptomeria japonica]|uniref:uncharacterized protein LOC131860129 n=1 Tax=Cryptomeria japonica TaxID=3369 RepID=UPI0027DA70EE|nr:uncharacterized protein LOC131860129 [Cryptomeria japonica]
MESDADIPKAPKKIEFARIIKKPQASAMKKGMKEKKAKNDPVLVSKPKRGKKIKDDLDEAMEFETISQDEATQSKNPSVNNVNKEEDTQDVAEQQILYSIEVESFKENVKSAKAEVAAPSGDTGAQESPKEDKTRSVEAEKKVEEKQEEPNKGNVR